MPLTYAPATTGKIIDTSVKNACSGMTGSAGAGAGKIAWTQVLTNLYKDFDTTLSTMLTAWLSTTTVIFPPGIPVILLVQPVMPAMTTLASSAGRDIDSKIKAACSGMTGASAAGAGAIAWKIVTTRIGQDILSNFPAAITTACTPGVVIVPPGFSAPPMVASLAPAPPAFAGWKTDLLKSLMTPMCTTQLPAAGPVIDKNGKAAASGLTGANGAKAGAIMWNTMIQTITPIISTGFSTALVSFMTGSLGTFLTQGGSGLPLSSKGKPTKGGTALPASLILI